MTEKQEEDLKKEVKKLSDAKEKVVEPNTVDKVQADLDKLKAVNDAFQAEELRAEEIRAKKMIGGKAEAGQPEESEEDKADKEAGEILDNFT